MKGICPTVPKWLHYFFLWRGACMCTKGNLLPSCCQRHFKNVSKSKSFASRINKAKQDKGYCICAPCWQHKTRILVPPKQADDLLKTQIPLQTTSMLQANCTKSPQNLPFQLHAQAKPVEETLISTVISKRDTGQQTALHTNAPKSSRLILL